jgi:hypothetical protein
MPRIGTGGADGSAEQRPGARATAGLVVAASALVLTASLFIGLRFFTHYFALALPFWAALGGLAVERVSGIAGRVRRPHSAGRIPDRAPSRRLAWGGLIIGSIVALSLGLEVAGRPWRAAAVQTRRWVLSGGLARAGDPLLWPGRDPLAAKVARWVREHSASSDRIFVWGTRPHVAAYALRIPATHFVTCTFLTGLVPWERSAPEEDTSRWIVPGSWELLLSDLEVERPLFIVDASQDHLFGDGAYAPGRFPRLAAILAERYEPVFEAGEGDRMVVHRRKAP